MGRDPRVKVGIAAEADATVFAMVVPVLATKEVVVVGLVSAVLRVGSRWPILLVLGFETAIAGVLRTTMGIPYIECFVQSANHQPLMTQNPLTKDLEELQAAIHPGSVRSSPCSPYCVADCSEGLVRLP